ncbi:MAG: biotin--[acetyl-CoA-carboxylase] ligase [Tropheryma whipplei]|uniref:biotin--[biotin carboxyl-carrier protein] ligase n=1 Tax=Tropheryma whipplei (strain Twist) TaxID=203267 RepID=Q83H38_TROWT|nr:biotin--[acetyl-CoA-carboxylase] ligase [Tropheryma whipplei]AAO44121.1 biotin acetyl-CoA carboxylase ligase [Tropheryma whipplei str. Twist]MCO8182834.1 biotin--[acetyl-CoA-carboxylase] ligase [Tropheryma whipplei]MCO8190488.1 biotin--[acetyl-CoA-carboxylase] ligase [Tropheryma whipplei]CAD66718.1 putative protein ligase [Tropheryma whipplei TW08/27]
MFPCVFLDTVGSTNLYLLELLKAKDLDDFFAVFTTNQTAGRGRMARSWECKKGIALSVFLKHNLPGAYINWLPLVIGLAVVKAVNKMLEDATLPHRADIKWPNDVLINGKKLSGILIETPSDGNGLIVGIGLNVAVAPIATSICLRQVGLQASPKEVVSALLAEMHTIYQQLIALAAKDISFKDSECFGEIMRLCSTINKTVRVTGTKTFVGVAQGLDSLGRLVIRHSGDTSIVSAGDIEHLRAIDSL